MLQIYKTVTTCYLKSSQVIGVFSRPIWGSKIKQIVKKLAQKSAKYLKNLRISINSMNFQKPSNHFQNHPKIKTKTYPADCRKTAAVDSNKHDWDWNNRRFLYKNIFLSPIYFDGILWLNILLF